MSLCQSGSFWSVEGGSPPVFGPARDELTVALADAVPTLTRAKAHHILARLHSHGAAYVCVSAQRVPAWTAARVCLQILDASELRRMRWELSIEAC